MCILNSRLLHCSGVGAIHAETSHMPPSNYLCSNILAAAEAPPSYSVVVASCRLNNCNCAASQFHPAIPPGLDQTDETSATEPHASAVSNSSGARSSSVNICLESVHNQSCRRSSNFPIPGQELILCPRTYVQRSHTTNRYYNYENNTFYATKMEGCGCCAEEPPPPSYEEALEKERRDSLSGSTIDIF